MMVTFEVTKEQARMLDSLAHVVEVSRKAAQDAESRFVLATEAMFAGHIEGGAVREIDPESGTVTLEVE